MQHTHKHIYNKDIYLCVMRIMTANLNFFLAVSLSPILSYAPSMWISLYVQMYVCVCASLCMLGESERILLL